MAKEKDIKATVVGKKKYIKMTVTGKKKIVITKMKSGSENVDVTRTGRESLN